MSLTSPPRAVCTVIAKNGVPHARLLARSLQQSNPDVPLYALLADRVEGLFDPTAEPFGLLYWDDPALPDLASLAFRSTRRELTKALPPYLLRYLQAQGIRQVLYLDADTVVEGSLAGLWSRLDDQPVVVTPYPGLAAVGAGALAEGFLAAWTAHAEEATWQPVVDDAQAAGDWLAQAAQRFPRVGVVDEPGLNLGYWNLSRRRVEVRRGGALVDGEPLVTVHFSGFNPQRPYRVSTHAPSVTLDDIGAAAILFDQYAHLLAEAGFQRAQGWPYSIDHFDNGVFIPPLARLIYRQRRAEHAAFGNPFEADRPDSFFAWLNAIVDADAAHEGWTRFWRAAYQLRGDVQAVMPEPLEAQRDDFRRWTVLAGRVDFDVPDRLIPHLPPLSARDLSLTPSPTPGGGQGAGEGGEPRAGEETSPLLPPSAVGKGAGGSGPRPFGVNLLNVAALSGPVRLALDAAGLPYHLGGDTWTAGDDRPYAFDLVCIGPAQPPPRPASAGRPAIAVWDWPLADFPLEWRDATLAYAEIWTPSRLAQAAMARVTPTPVHVVPPAARASDPPSSCPPKEGGAGQSEGSGASRADLGWPEDACVFLGLVDPDAGLERQNPHGLIHAFKHAFGSGDKALLALRFTRPLDAAARAGLEEAAWGAAICLDDEPLAEDEARQMLALADAYVSLHRAEGAGGWLPEAMGQGRPVIATGYGGPLDWATPDSLLVVDYRLVPTRLPGGPYRRGLVWAEPDLASAARQMRWVYDHPDAAVSVGSAGREAARQALSPARVGEAMRRRLQSLYDREAESGQ